MPPRTPRRRPERPRTHTRRTSAARNDAPVPPSVSILDAAFRRAHRVSAHGTGRVDRARRRAELHLVRSFTVVLRHLRQAQRSATTPALTRLEHELVQLRFPAGALERSVRRVRTAEDRIRVLLRAEERELGRLSDPAEFAGLVRRAYGRLASFVREVDPDLVRLEAIHRFRRSRPELRPGEPTIVVAGFPNVGKSSLVARLSSARPEVAGYPFTTRAIAVGHTDLGFDRLQVVDTPGVLGRAERANVAEREAEATLRSHPTVIVYVLDPSETSGYPFADQETLLRRWRAEFPEIPIIEVETKGDLRRTDSGRLTISSKTEEGIRELRARLEALLKARRLVDASSGPSEGETPNHTA
jgi:nucleolar GTP-binding protein